MLRKSFISKRVKAIYYPFQGIIVAVSLRAATVSGAYSGAWALRTLPARKMTSQIARLQPHWHNDIRRRLTGCVFDLHAGNRVRQQQINVFALECIEHIQYVTDV